MKSKVFKAIYKIFWTALDWVYPPECAVCGVPGDRLCDNCLEQIQFSNSRVNASDGELYPQHNSQDKISQDVPLPHSCRRHLAEYEGVMRECIHALKYENNQGLGIYFSSRLAAFIRNMNWIINLVIPVPLSPERIRERGYNQSALIARPLSYALDLDYTSYGLKRIKHTHSQVGLSALERQRNVRGAFTALPEVISGKRILLVDDVTTTGATLQACAIALAAADAQFIYAVTLAGFSKEVSLMD